MRRYRWIFFDLFDTLCVLDEEGYYEGKRRSAEAAGVPFEAFMEAWRATAQEASVGAIRDPFARAQRALEPFSIEDRRICAEVARLDIETIQHTVAFYPGATDALALLRARGFRLGLISNATATTAFAVAPLHLRERLDTLTFSYEARAAKPDAVIFQKALQRSGCGPQESLFVGDGANRELDAARNLGFATLCMDHPVKGESFRRRDTLSSKEHPCVCSFRELLDLEDLQQPEGVFAFKVEGDGSD